MTQPAIRTHALLVHIIRLVTDMAVSGSRFICRGQVTLFARRDGMQAEQRESGHVMFETYLSCPSTFVMAFPALFSFLTPVHIILAVTAETLDCQLFPVNFPLVAG